MPMVFNYKLPITNCKFPQLPDYSITQFLNYPISQFSGYQRAFLSGQSLICRQISGAIMAFVFPTGSVSPGVLQRGIHPANLRVHSGHAEKEVGLTESKVSADAKWELVILGVVHGFYLGLLRKSLEEEVPIPPGLDPDSLRAPRDLQKSLTEMRRWLKLLDLAITPAMVRETLNADVDQDLAEALLRYYVRKKSHTNYDRDKTDFVATFLYRNPRVNGQWETHGYSMDGVAPLPPFEIALLEVLGDDYEFPQLTPQQVQLLDGFQQLRKEVDGLRHFDAMIDSDVIQKARELKQDLGSALYHPHVLAEIAPYNAFVAARFGELFQAATTHLKDFAEQVQSKGGGIDAPVGNGFTVKDLTEVRESEILNTEYLRAQDQFRYVSRLKKAVDALKAAQHATPPKRSAPAAAPVSVPPPVAAETIELVGPGDGEAAAPAEAGAAIKNLAIPKAMQVEEESRLRSVQDSIRSFVQAADPRYRQVGPMRFGNFGLTAAEADAYCAEYLGETSFRGDCARALVRITALVARMTGEVQQFQQQQNSKYLWRPHADSMAFLLWAKEQIGNETGRLADIAKQRGLAEKANSLNASLQKLKTKSDEVSGLLNVAAGLLKTQA